MNLFAKKFTGILAAAAIATASCTGIALSRSSSYQTSLTIARGDRIYTEYQENTQTLSIWGTGSLTVDELRELKDKEKIKTITVSKGITSIGEKAFEDFRGAVSITLPDGLLKIEQGAFTSCLSLKGLRIPKSTDEIDASGIFIDCPVLSSVKVTKGNKNYTSTDGILYSSDMTKLIYYPQGRSRSSFSVPQEVTTVISLSCPFLKSVTLPEGLREIKAGAMAECRALGDVYIPSENCVLSGKDIFPSAAVIHAPAGSTAEEYCRKNNITFREL